LAKNNNINNLVQTRAIVNPKKELRTVVTSKTNSMSVINFDGISKNKRLCSMTELQMAMDCTFHEIPPQPPHIMFISCLRVNNNNMVQTRAIVNAKKELTTIVASKTDNMRVINFD
jgi:hypothetical protein